MVKRLIIGMSGASGAPLTVELLRQLHDHCPEVETHLIVTKGGEMTLSQSFSHWHPSGTPTAISEQLLPPAVSKAWV